MKQLIEDYKRRLKNIDEVIKEFKSNGSVNDLKKEVRLNTKASEYRTFIVELEHALSEKENVKSPWGVIVQGENVQPDTIQPDQTPKLVSLIDFSLLRTQKKTLIEMIDDFEKRGVEPDKLIDLDGILNLIDSIQDFATDVMGLNPIDIYDFELEENREDVIKPEDSYKQKIKKLFITTSDDEPVLDIIVRKQQGIDCTEEESAEIKGYLRELKLPEEQPLVAEIQLLFPQEYGEFLDENNQDGYL
jgi:hypothetical protein